LIDVLNYLLPLLYALTIGAYIVDFLREKESLSGLKRSALLTTLLLHTGYLIARTITFEHPPITNKFEIFTVLAFSVAFCYFIIELMTDIKRTGSFILVFSLVFQVLSTAFIQDLVDVKEVLKNPLLGFHVFTVLLAYSAFTLSAVYGVLFIILYRRLQSNEYGIFFNRLPNLEVLEKLSFIAVVLGFINLTISISIGGIWLPQAFPDFSMFDPKLISSFSVWIVYGVAVGVRMFAGWYGRKVIYFSLAGYSLAILSLLLINMFGDTFHNFY